MSPLRVPHVCSQKRGGSVVRRGGSVVRFEVKRGDFRPPLTILGRRPEGRRSMSALVIFTPGVADPEIVVAAVEAERPELAVTVAHSGEGARILVRVGIEDVLRPER